MRAVHIDGPGIRKRIELGEEIGRGGEGRVYAVHGYRELAGKLYTRPGGDYERRLATLLTTPWDDWLDGAHVQLTWPMRRLLDPGTEALVGHLMYRVPPDSAELSALLWPASRRRAFGAVSWAFLVAAARDLAAVVARLHERGYVVGDLGHDNVYVNGYARVTLIDCTSMQFRDRTDGTLFPCPVGKDEYLAPELQGADLARVERAPSSDAFSLAVLACRLLMEGEHPFYGIPKDQLEDDTETSISSNITGQHTRYVRPERLVPVPRVLPLETLPPQVRELAERCFGDGHEHPNRRPPAAAWAAALDSAHRELQRCDRSALHLYHPAVGGCPWCARMAAGDADRYPVDDRPAATRLPTGRGAAPDKVAAVTGPPRRSAATAPSGRRRSATPPSRPPPSWPPPARRPPGRPRRAYPPASRRSRGLVGGGGAVALILAGAVGLALIIAAIIRALI